MSLNKFLSVSILLMLTTNNIFSQGVKPTDFPHKPVLDGSEELYTQKDNSGIGNKRFTVEILKKYIADNVDYQIKGDSLCVFDTCIHIWEILSHLNVDNGLIWKEDTVVLGGKLIHDTEINKDTFDINFSGTGNFTIEKGKLGVGMTSPRHPLQLAGSDSQTQLFITAHDNSGNVMRDSTINQASLGVFIQKNFNVEPHLQFNFFRPDDLQPNSHWRPTRPNVGLIYLQDAGKSFNFVGKTNLTPGVDFKFTNEDHIFSIDIEKKTAYIGFSPYGSRDAILKLNTANDNGPKLTFSANGATKHNGFSVSPTELMYETRNLTSDHVFYGNSFHGSGRELMRIKSNFNIIFNDTGTVRLPRLLSLPSGHVPSSGQIYYDSTSSKLNLYSVNSWKKIPTLYQYTPSSSTDTNGNEGDITYDTNYLYIKTDKWRRVELEEF